MISLVEKKTNPQLFLQRPEHGVPIGSFISILELLDVASTTFQKNSLVDRSHTFASVPVDVHTPLMRYPSVGRVSLRYRFE